MISGFRERERETEDRTGKTKEPSCVCRGEIEGDSIREFRRGRSVDFDGDERLIGNRYMKTRGR